MQARSFATARLSALLRGYALGLFIPTRPGPRFLESPDANGRTLSDASAAGTLQSDHAPDGTMPRPPASQERRTPPAGTAPAPSVASPVDVPHNERDGSIPSISRIKVKKKIESQRSRLP